MASVGTVIGGRFRVDQFLGFGGMGLVVAATHLELGHRVAIKFLRNEMAANPTVVERFLREARSVVHLRTEHVCRVSDVGHTDAGAPYMVMELLEGNDLGKVVATQPLPLTVAVEYVLQASVAIAEAHAIGIVHRDLKPANLFVTRRPGGGPLIKVLDFGIAKAVTEASAQLTHSSSMLGSPAYISPEQLQSARDVDARTDIWALGATLYQLLSARLPFHRPNATEMAVRIVMEPPDPLDIDPALRAVVMRCLEKSPAQRYQDIAALAADLAPFGGPSGRAFAGLVAKMLRGDSATVAPSTALGFAGTALASAPVLPTPIPARRAASAPGFATPIPPARIATAAVSGTSLAPPPAETSPGGHAAGASAGGMPAGARAGRPSGGMPGAHAGSPVAGSPGTHAGQSAGGMYGPHAGGAPAGGAVGRPAGMPPGPGAHASGVIHGPHAGQAGGGAPPPVAHPADAFAGGPPRRRNLGWWIGAPLIVLASAGVALLIARPGAQAPAPPAAGSESQVAVVATPTPTPVAPAPTPAAPAPSAPAAPAGTTGEPGALTIPPAPPKEAQPKTVRRKPPAATAPAATAGSGSAAAAAPSPPPAPGSGGHDSGTVVGNVKSTAREAKDTCLEDTADTPFNTAMCWCQKKDRARAQAAYAKLSKFKRTVVREFCAVRGVHL